MRRTFNPELASIAGIEYNFPSNTLKSKILDQGVIEKVMGPLLMAWGVLFHCRNAEEIEAHASLDGVRLAGSWPDIGVMLGEGLCFSLQQSKGT